MQINTTAGECVNEQPRNMQINSRVIRKLNVVQHANVKSGYNEYNRILKLCSH